MNWTEKREQDRITLSLPVEYYRIDSDYRLIGYLHQGYTINASERGLMVLSRNRMPRLTDVRIRLFFSYPDLRFVETLSRVIWGTRREKDSDYLVGMQVVWGAQDDLKRWEQFLNSLSRLKRY